MANIKLTIYKAPIE